MAAARGTERHYLKRWHQWFVRFKVRRQILVQVQNNQSDQWIDCTGPQQHRAEPVIRL
jgi:hypothetical protein